MAKPGVELAELLARAAEKSRQAETPAATEWRWTATGWGSETRRDETDATEVAALDGAADKAAE